MTSTKHLMRKSKKGLVCPTCGNVESNDKTLDQVFGYGMVGAWMCPKCHTSLNVYRKTETVYSTFTQLASNEARSE